MPKLLLTVTVATLLGVCALHAQTREFSDNDASKPIEVTYCELSRNPIAFNHELVRVTTFVTHGFENFLLADPTCPTQGFSVWVMYGGTTESGTVYCCPGEGTRSARRKTLAVEGVQIPLVKDVKFQQFTQLLDKEGDSTVRITAVGRFFSGEKETIDGVTSWTGAGHMGCCSLLVIQRIVAFEPHASGDLDYSAEAGSSENADSDSGCFQYRRRVFISYPEAAKAIEEQKSADSGEATWRFSDPEHVAIESLRSFYPSQVPDLLNVKKTSARRVFRWKNGDKEVVVVVIRPYWLSFYAASTPVAWIATTVKEVGCSN
jgi:hypothetical protein